MMLWHLISIQIAGMEIYFSMMAIHCPMTTPMELYLCVSTMCMVLYVMTSDGPSIYIYIV